MNVNKTTLHPLLSRFCLYLFLHEKVCSFSSSFLYVHIRTYHTMLDKSFPSNFFCKGVQFYFEISLSSFIHEIFEQNFDQYVAVYLVRIWTCENADDKEDTFHGEEKTHENRQKRTKTDAV